MKPCTARIALHLSFVGVAPSPIPTIASTSSKWFRTSPIPGQLPTRYLSDASKSIISRNDSPDVPFDLSLNPYRGCEHGCIYLLCPPQP